jgi:predicted patatin/cPLA2 family phospholipase
MMRGRDVSNLRRNNKAPAVPGLVLRFAAVLLWLTLSTAGCSWHERACIPLELNRPGALIQTGDDPKPVDPELFGSLAKRLKFEADPGFASTAGPIPGRKALVLSSGGKYGAYAVGVLSGWTASGNRPVFDVVTGISTGGLIATCAFLGSEYDQKLINLYTSVRTQDVYRRRPLIALLWADAAASSRPLKHLIDAETNDELIRAVAAAHAAGRRLYVGTTNVDTGRLVIWDMGAIAASGRPDAKELYRCILLATCSVPGLLPPVPITVTIDGQTFTELHVDGGATTSVFLRASELNIDEQMIGAGRPPLVDSDAYVIVSGKLYSDPKCAKRNAIKIGARSLDSLVASQTRGELFRIYTLSLLSGMRFHLASLPDDFPPSGPGMLFDPVQMRRLYDVGYQMGISGRAWRDDTPVDDTAEQSPPRRGNEFASPPHDRP